MNKLSIFAMSVAVTASLLATPLASQEIVVSPTSPSEFVDNVQKDLDRHLRQIRVSPQSLQAVLRVYALPPVSTDARKT